MAGQDEKNQGQLLKELEKLRQKVAELEIVKRQYKWAQERIDHEKKEIQEYLDIANAIIIVVNKTGIVTLINKRGSEILGFKKSEIVGKNWFENFVPSDIRKDLWRAFTDLMGGKAGSYEQHENYVLTKKGHLRTVRWHNALLRNERGEITALLSSGEDVTSYRKAEESLKKSESTLKTTFFAAPIGIGLVNNRIFQWVNDYVVCLTGYSRKELEGKSARLVYPTDEEFERVGKLKYGQLKKTGKGVVETRWQRKDGVVIEVLLSSAPLDKNDLAAGVIFTVVDITESKRSQAALKVSEEKYRELYEGTRDGLAAVDMEGNIIECNAAFARMLDYPVVDVYKFTYEDITPAKWHSAERKILQEQVMKRGYSDLYEKEYVRRDGTVFPVELRTFLTRDAHGAPCKMWATVRDASERKKIQQDMLFTQSVVEHMGDASIWLTSEGRVCYANEAASKLLGYSNRELLSKVVHDFDVNFPKRQWQERWEELKNLKEVRFETTFAHKDKKHIPVELTVNYIAYDGKEYLCGIMRDLTERKKFERRVLFAQSVVERMGDCALWLSSTGSIVYANVAICNLLGYSRQELLQKSIFDIDVRFEKKDWPARWQEIKKIKTCRTETEYRAKSGAVIPVELAANYIQENGTEYLCSIARDLTERKQAERALKASEQEKEVILSSLSEMVIFHDMSGGLRWANRALCHFIGLKPEELIGRKCSDLWHRSNLPCKSCTIEKVRASGNVEAQEVFLAPDSWWFIRGYPVKDPTGALTGVVEVILDITERKKAEQERRETLEKSRRILDETVIALAATAERRDPYTAGHQRRVAELACAIGRELGFDSDQLEGLRMSSIIHDVGKVYVPVEILSKPSKLTDLEFSIIQTHPHIGYEILKPVEFPWPVAQIVLQHHEKLNGSGYPEGLTEKSILLEAKVLTVADVVEAMASHRPYRPALGIDAALKEISKNKGVLYDERAVEACLKLFRKKLFSFT